MPPPYKDFPTMADDCIDKITIAGRLSELTTVRRFVRRVCESVPDLGGEKAMHRAVLAADEVVVNIIEHAYGGDDGKGTIRIDSHCDPDALVFSFHDWSGSPFQPPPEAFSLPENGPDGPSDRNRGLFLIDQCVDTVEFIYDEREGRNCVRLVFRRQTGEG